jgi:oxygen-independent coproporphyrinogen-3 oxidase
MYSLTDTHLLKKYNTNAPRYTSYPTALTFTKDFSAADFICAVKRSTQKDLALYIHIPFCHSLCYYCGCNKVVTRQQDKADIYLNYLENEILLRARLFLHKKVHQVHFGGGTPSFLTVAQISRSMDILRSHFSLVKNAEISIEIDPRRISPVYLDHLKQQGFNRISFGVQDTNKKVQVAINRLQDTQFIAQLVKRAKQLGFKSVNLDLIYGLPWQDEHTFAKTLSDIIAMQPDRVSLFSYAHLPTRFAAQRKIHDNWLPSPELKALLMLQAISTLTNHGYEMIGMDHFALRTDELTQAQRAGVLHRNFQGYTVLQNCDLLGLGVSSISTIGNTFSQNHKELNDYYASLDDSGDALEKGVVLTQDDQIRASVIKDLMCNGRIDKQNVEQNYHIDFDHYFADSLLKLEQFIDDGLITQSNKKIELQAKGRLLVRHIAMVFDAYTAKEQCTQYSKVL